MTDTEQRSTSLLDLPVELIEWIFAELTSSTDLFNLRLTCQDLNAITTSTFMRRFFKDRSFILADRRSMETLLNISKHERLARAMKLIRFSLALLAPQDRWSPRNSLHCASLPPSHSSNGQLCLEGRLNHDQLFDEQESYIGGFLKRQDGCDMEQDLQHIFRNFMRKGTAPGIVAIREESEVQPWGLTRFKNLLRTDHPLGIDYCLFGEMTIRKLTKAISVTNYPLSELVLGSIDQPLHLRDLVRNHVTPRHLRKLDLVLHPSASDHDETSTQRVWQSQLVAGLLKILSKTQILEELALGLDSFSSSRAFHEQTQVGILNLSRLSGQPALPRLKRFRLTGFAIHIGAIEKIVRQHISTLEELTLTNLPYWSRELGACRERIEHSIEYAKPGKQVTVCFTEVARLGTHPLFSY